MHVHSRIGRFNLELPGMDAVITVGDGTWPGLVAHHLLDETVLPVISPALARQHPLHEPADLAQHLLLQVAARPDTWQRWFITQGLPLQRMRLGPQFELTLHLIQVVASGIGVGLVPEFLVEEELRSGVLQRAIGRPMDTGAGYDLFVPPDNLSLPPIAAFVQWLMEERALQA